MKSEFVKGQECFVNNDGYVEIYFDGILECGACIQGALACVKKGATMEQIIDEMKNLGYVSFRIGSMKSFVRL